MAARLGVSLSSLVVLLLPLFFQPVLAFQAGLDYYEVLGVEREATPADVRKAYRREALEWHPDKNPERREEAEERFRRIAEAYSVLSNSDARSRYDRERRFSAGSGFGGGFGGSSAGRSGRGAGRADGTGGHHQRSSGESFKSEDFSFSFESAEDLFRQFFGGEDPFREAREQIEKGRAAMTDAIREGEAIASRFGDLLKAFAGEPDAGGGERAAERDRGRAERARERERRAGQREQRARERERMASSEPASRKRDREEGRSRTREDAQARADGRERLREERAQRAEQQRTKRGPSSSAEQGGRARRESEKTTRSRDDSAKSFGRKAQADFEKPSRKQQRDFKKKNQHRNVPEFDLASVIDAGMNAFQSKFQDWRPEL